MFKTKSHSVCSSQQHGFKMKMMLMTFLICSLVLISLTYAQVQLTPLEKEDNIKEYDIVKREVTIKNNNSGLNNSEVAKITLISPTDMRVFDRGRGVMQLVAEFHVENFYQDYENAFKKIELFNIKTGMLPFNRKIEYKYKKLDGFRTLKTYRTVCDKEVLEILPNKTEVKNCYQVIDEEWVEPVYIWVDFNEKELLKEGNVTIGLFTDVQRNEKIEWIPTFFDNVRVHEWATWTSGMNEGLESCFTFNETGNPIVEQYFGVGNITAQNTPTFNVSAILNNSVDFDGSSEYADVTDIYGATDRTIAFWLQWNKDTGDGQSQRILSDASTIDLQIQVSNGLIYGGGNFCNNFGAGFGAMPEDRWVHVVFTANTSTCRMYINGSKNNEITGSYTNQNFGNMDLARTPTPHRYMDGIFDQLIIWNRTLTNSEIENLYNSHSGLDCDQNPSGSSTLDLLFTNTTNATDYKTIFDEGENFIAWANYTDDSDGSAIDNSEGACNFTLHNVTIEEEAVNNSFTLCDSGCDIDNPLKESFTLESSNVTEPVEKDFLRIEICHDDLAQRDLEVEFECSSTTSSHTINASQFGLCSQGYTEVSVDDYACMNETTVNISLDNNANTFNRRHNISEWEYDRKMINHTETYAGGGTHYNSTHSLWRTNDTYESYEHGTLRVDANCSYTADSGLNNNVPESITIVNLPPTILFGQLHVPSGTTYDIDSTDSGNPTLVTYEDGQWEWIMPIEDDDIDTHNQTWYNGSGSLVTSTQELGQQTAHNTTNGTFYPMENVYNLTIWVNDTNGNQTQESFYFNVSPQGVLPAIAYIVPNDLASIPQAEALII